MGWKDGVLVGWYWRGRELVLDGVCRPMRSSNVELVRDTWWCAGTGGDWGEGALIEPPAIGKGLKLDVRVVEPGIIVGFVDVLEEGNPELKERASNAGAATGGLDEAVTGRGGWGDRGGVAERMGAV